MWTSDIALWSGISFLTGIGGTLLFQATRDNKINLKWYEWVLGVTGVALLFFTIQNFVTGFREFAPKASMVFLMVTGIPSVILIGLAWRLSSMRKRTV